MAEPDPTEPLQVPAVWVGGEDSTVQAVNQMVGQVSGREEIILTFGEFVPPALLGTPEERLAQAKQITFLPVQVVARLGLTKSRLEEFLGVIEQTLDNYAKMFGEERHGDADAESG